MCFRESLERDKVTPDVYFKYGPGWSNMGYSVWQVEVRVHVASRAPAARTHEC